MVVWQTMTGGDEGPSNGRIESEVQQVKKTFENAGERKWS